jgi:hypothetical protein
MNEIPQCRFGDGEAAVRVAMDKGCTCYPDDREQLLCFQHAHESEPLGSWKVIEEFYEPDL